VRWGRAGHVYLVLSDGKGRSGRVLLRGRLATIEYFGLDALPHLELSYRRQGGIQIGKWRTSPRKVNWQSFRIEVPEVYPSGKRMKGWMVSVSANCRMYHLQSVAEAIESSGVAWNGFQRATGAKWLPKQHFLKNSPHVNA